jgi:hypothetical protein
MDGQGYLLRSGSDDRALWRPLLRFDHASIFERACRQPFGNQPDESPVANPMLDESDDLVEKGLNVAIEQPVDPPLPDPERECIQRLMLVTLRSETVAEAQELRLIDRRQSCRHRGLDDLVLIAAMPSGRCLPFAFGMYFRRDGSARCAPVWTRTCSSRRFASRCFAYSVHVISSTPGAAVFFRPKKLARKTFDVDVRQKRRQLALPVPVACS